MKFLPKKMLPISRQPRPPPVAESESALDRTNHVSLHSRRSRIRAYSKYDYPAAANDPLGDTGHGTQSSSASPIPSEITIKLDDLHGGAFPGSSDGSSSPWVHRRAPPPAVDHCLQRPRGATRPSRIEGHEDQDADDEEQATHAGIGHDATNTEQSNEEHNDSSAAMAENTATSTGSISAQNTKPESSRSAAPPSYDECVQLGLFDSDKKHRTTTAASTTCKQTSESYTGAISANIQTETTTTTTTTTTTATTTTSDVLATGMPHGVYASASVPNSMEPISSSSAAQTTSAQFPSTNDDLLSYGFQDEDDEEDADLLQVEVPVGKRRARRRATTATTNTTRTTATTNTGARSIRSAPPPSTTRPTAGPAPTRLVHQDSLLSTSRSMASKESVREEMGRILAALHHQHDGDTDEQPPQEQQPASTPTRTSIASSSTRSSSALPSSSSPPSSSSSSSSSPPPTSAKRPVYLDVPMGTSLYPQIGGPVPTRHGSEYM